MDEKEEKRTAYIPIIYPYTLDASRDPRDNINASGGVFVKLTNYITGRQNLETRRGIGEFLHTSASTPAPPTNDFSGDPDCVGLWNMDNNYLDSIGGNHMSGNGTFSVDYKQGTHSLDLEMGSTQYTSISDPNIDAGFPGKNGVGELSWSLAAWLKPETVATWMGIFMKWNIIGDLRTIGIMLDSTAKIRAYIGHTAGTLAYDIQYDTAINAATWYHLGVSYNATNNLVTIRMRNGSTGNLVDSNKTGNSPSDNSPRAGDLAIGRQPGGTSYFDGKLDEIVFFKKVLSDADFDKIYAGTYS